MPRLLIVDDEPRVLAAFSKVFARPALEVFTAPDGRQALDLVRK
jgi:DNA-binding response OmpR family regulator